MCMASCKILAGSSSSTALVPAVQHQIQEVSDDSETDVEVLTGDEIGGGGVGGGPAGGNMDGVRDL